MADLRASVNILHCRISPEDGHRGKCLKCSGISPLGGVLGGERPLGVQRADGGRIVRAVCKVDGGVASDVQRRNCPVFQSSLVLSRTWPCSLSGLVAGRRGKEVVSVGIRCNCVMLALRFGVAVCPVHFSRNCFLLCSCIPETVGNTFVSDQQHINKLIENCL